MTDLEVIQKLDKAFTEDTFIEDSLYLEGLRRGLMLHYLEKGITVWVFTTKGEELLARLH